MGKSMQNSVPDASLAEIATGTRFTVCSAEPTNFAEATTAGAFMLAIATVVAGDGNGDFVISDGDTSGRKVRMTAQTGVIIGTAGTANHIAIVDFGNSKLLIVTTCTTQVLAAGGNTVTIPAFDWESTDPT